MKRILLIVFGLLISVNASAFDINEYCIKVSNAVGGSYQIEKACREQENAALTKINSMNVPEHIKKYCEQVGQAVGGSYQIMEACIQQELEAKNSLYWLKVIGEQYYVWISRKWEN